MRLEKGDRLKVYDHPKARAGFMDWGTVVEPVAYLPDGGVLVRMKLDFQSEWAAPLTVTVYPTVECVH